MRGVLLGSLREFLISSVYAVLVGSTGAVPLASVRKVLASSVLGCTSDRCMQLCSVRLQFWAFWPLWCVQFWLIACSAWPVVWEAR